jgi:hypothetical protein
MRRAGRKPRAAKGGKAETKRPAPPRRRRQLGEEELPDDYDDLEDELEDMPEGASSNADPSRRQGVAARP